jgi:hypothetical protein
MRRTVRVWRTVSAKAGATRAAESGAIVHQLMALFGMEDRDDGADLYAQAGPQAPCPDGGTVIVVADTDAEPKSPAPWVGYGGERNQCEVSNGWILSGAQKISAAQNKWCPRRGPQKAFIFQIVTVAVGEGESGPFDS